MTAVVSGLFCLLVVGGMVYEHCIASATDPWKAPELLALKEKLAAEPKNTALQGQIRELDRQYRQKFRRRLALDGMGGWLLFGGVLTLVLTARGAMQLKSAMPLPGRTAQAALSRINARARWSVAAAGLAVAGVLLLIRLGYTSVLPDNSAAWEKMLAQKAPEENAPSLPELQANWPRFRGWDGSGISSATVGASLQLLWHSAIPTPGQGSPVIWGNRIFVTGGTAEKREVFCYNTTDGALAWRQSIINVAGSPALVKIAGDAGCASPSAATDGRHLYAIFGNGDVAALDLGGSVIWTKFLGSIKNSYGYAASLAISGRSLILQLDQGDSPTAGSKLLALECTSGRPLWERSRPVSESWATPIIVDAGGQAQIVTAGNPWVIGYRADNGQELWRANLLENEIVPSPVFAGGYVLVTSPNSKLFALRPDGSGDVTQTHVAWTNQENVPDIASPVASGDLVFTAASSGIVTCLQLKDGKKVWDADVGKEVHASPGLAGGHLFILSTDGALMTLEAGRQFHELGRLQLSDKFVASPAFADGRVFLRGLTNLYCLGPGGTKLAGGK
jgi:outer membrane protein assembly factor BamB